MRIIPIGEDADLLDYARSIETALRANQVRVTLDASSNKMQGKIQEAEQKKVHTMLVLGRRDLESANVSVRVHGKGNLGARPRAEVVADVRTAIEERRP